MNYPKIKLVKALENYQLIVEFDNNQQKNMMSPHCLRNQCLVH